VLPIRDGRPDMMTSTRTDSTAQRWHGRFATQFNWLFRAVGWFWGDAAMLAVGAFAYDGVIRDALRGVKAGGRHAAATPRKPYSEHRSVRQVFFLSTVQLLQFCNIQ
jgi:hypothetical protein